MEQIRCFIAIELPQGIKDELGSWEERIRESPYAFVKWVDPEGIHLTLKFLGNIDSTTLPQIIEAVNKAAQGKPAFYLQIEGIGVFPNWQRPEVVWVGVGGEVEKLIALQQSVDTALTPLGFPRESRPFTPHLTLARLRGKASPKERQTFGEQVRSISLEAGTSFVANSVSVMRSQLTPKGAIYTRLAFIELEK